MMILLRDPVPWADRKSPERVADWIKSRIPCPEGGYKDIPIKIRDKIRYYLIYESKVTTKIVMHAMKIVFGDPIKSINMSDTIQDEMGPANSAATNDEALLYFYEDQFKFAQLHNNLDTMNAILESIVRLLIHWAGGREERFEEANRRMRRLAPRVHAQVRHLTRKELRLLRAAPTPNLVRLGVHPRTNVQSARRRAK